MCEEAAAGVENEETKLAVQTAGEKLIEIIREQNDYEQGTAMGAFDAAAVCLGNGLAAGCSLPANEITLNIQRDEDKVEGTAAVTVRLPGDQGCPDWIISSQIQMTGLLVGLNSQVVQGTVNVISNVKGYVVASCNPLVRNVPIEGTWEAKIEGDQITGQIVTPGPAGDAVVPFVLEVAWTTEYQNPIAFD